MSKAFTVFCHGTDFHRDKVDLSSDIKAEVIDTLSKAVQGAEARLEKVTPTTSNPLGFRLTSRAPSHIICEGPGSDEVSEDNSSSEVKHAHPGKHNPIFGTEKHIGSSQTDNSLMTPKGRRKLFGGRKTSPFQDDFMGSTKKPWKTSGLISGAGWDDNVYKVVWFISHLIMEVGQKIDTINLVGWSRGGVTCLKIANKLNEVFPDLTVNICAVDPVPGKNPTSHKPDVYTITPNIEDYLGLLAIHERRLNFRPACLDIITCANSNSPRKPNVCFLTFPGSHTDVAIQRDSEDMKSYEVILDTAKYFLEMHGTVFKQDEIAPLGRSNLISYYDTMVSKLEDYATDAESSDASNFNVPERAVAGGYKWRNVYSKMNQYAPPGYLNLHHYCCKASEPIPNKVPAIHPNLKGIQMWRNWKNIWTKMLDHIKTTL